MTEPAPRDNADVLIWRLRGERVPYRDIADRLRLEGHGMDASTVMRRYKRMLSHEVPDEEVDHRRAEEARLLDELSSEAFGILRDTQRVERPVFGDDGQPITTGGRTVTAWAVEYAHQPQHRLRAIRELSNLSKRRSDLFGLDAPKRIEVDGLSRDPLGVMLEKIDMGLDAAEAFANQD